MEEDEELDETSKKQASPADRIRPWMFKKGQSGNPAGRPKGVSMKEWAKIYLERMTDDERLDFLDGLDKETVWKMAEGNPVSTSELTGKDGDPINIDITSQLSKVYGPTDKVSGDSEASGST